MLNFPIKKQPPKQVNQKNIKKANLGMLLEDMLNDANNYYLDKGDFKGAKTTIDRLISLLDYMPQSAKVVVKTMALYASSTFDFNEDLADDYMSDLEKYLNNLNNATNIRTKLAYIYYVVKEEDKQILTDFYQKGIREAQKDFIKGEGLFEIKLLEKIKNEF